MPLIEFTGCNACSLRHEWPKLAHPVMPFCPPSQPCDYRVLILGEGPGETEDNLGVPFVGRAGQLLREHLGDWQYKVFWQNMVRCRPPKNRTPTPEEMKCCSTFLLEDLYKIRPHAILGLGGAALEYWCPSESIGRIRGIPFAIELPDGSTCWYFPTYHPSYVMRSGEDSAIVPVFKNDLRRFFQRLPDFAANPPRIIPPPQPEDLVVAKSEEEALNLYARLRHPHAVDVETFKKKPYQRDARLLTASYSDGDLTFGFPVSFPGDINPWGKKAFEKIQSIDDTWIASHASFELVWILYNVAHRQRSFEDIEVLARLIHNRRGLGSLDILTRIYLGWDVKDISKLDKNRLAEYPVETVLLYNNLDSWTEAVAWLELRGVFPEDQLDNYHRTLRTIESTVEMELQGLHVDLTKSEELKRELSTKQLGYEQDAKVIPEVKLYESQEKKVFSLSSPPAVARIITRYCGIQLPKTGKLDKQGNENYSTDADELEKLVGMHPIIDLVLDYREVAKLKSTYVDPILSGKLLGIDFLLHAAYTVIHTATYRLSSEDPNIQNFPKRKHKEVRKQIVAPPGHLMAAFDYGQLEARVMAMASRDKNLCRAIIEKEDIHSKWLDRIIHAYPLYLDRLADKTNQREEKAIRKYGRDIIKTDFVFASLYGSVAESIANRTGLPLAKVKEVWEEFWAEYYGVRTWIDAQFEYYKSTGTIKSLTNRIRDEVVPGMEPINTPIQGTAAELVEEAQNALHQKAMNEGDIYLCPRINIHDDLVFYLPDDSSTDNYIETIGKEIVLPRFDFNIVPLMTECRVGYNWAELEPVTNFIGEYYQ